MIRKFVASAWSNYLAGILVPDWIDAMGDKWKNSLEAAVRRVEAQHTRARSLVLVDVQVAGFHISGEGERRAVTICKRVVIDLLSDRNTYGVNPSYSIELRNERRLTGCQVIVWADHRLSVDAVTVGDLRFPGSNVVTVGDWELTRYLRVVLTPAPETVG